MYYIYICQYWEAIGNDDMGPDLPLKLHLLFCVRRAPLEVVVQQGGIPTVGVVLLLNRQGDLPGPNLREGPPEIFLGQFNQQRNAQPSEMRMKAINKWDVQMRLP